MGVRNPEGTIARFDLGDGHAATAVIPVSDGVGPQKVTVLALSGNPSLLVNGNEHVTGENIGTGDGTLRAFTATLAKSLVHPSRVTIVATNTSNATMTVTDDGSGALTGNGTGTIDYATGAVAVTFSAAVKNATAVTIAYYAKKRLTAGPSAGQVWRDCIVRLVLAGGKVFDATGFGNGSGLSSGIDVTLGAYSLPFAAKYNVDLSAVSSATHTHNEATTDGWIAFDFDAGVLDGDAGDVCAMTVQEDLSGVTSPSMALAMLLYRELA